MPGVRCRIGAGRGDVRVQAGPVRIRLQDGKLTVTDGPFTEATEVIVGYTMVQLRSPEQASSWVAGSWRSTPSTGRPSSGPASPPPLDRR